MHRCFGSMIPLAGLQDLHGQPDPTPTIPSSFESILSVRWLGSPTSAVIGLTVPAKANIRSGDGFLFTNPAGETTALYFAGGGDTAGEATAISNGAGYNDDDTSIVVGNGAAFSIGDVIQPEGSFEWIQITNIVSNTLTVVRAYKGTVASSLTDNQKLWVVPADLAAADTVVYVDITADTTEVDVMDALLTALNGAAIGLETVIDWADGTAVIATTGTGASMNSWEVVEYINDAGGEIWSQFGTDPAVFEGGIDTDDLCIVQNEVDGVKSLIWLGDVGDVTEYDIDLALVASAELPFGLDIIGAPVATSQLTNLNPAYINSSFTQPADTTLNSGQEEPCRVSITNTTTDPETFSINIFAVSRSITVSVGFGFNGITE